jgi:hypothetical protein
MSYGVLLKNANSNQIIDDELNFYSTSRASISTSDPMYFSLVGFNSSFTMELNFSEFGSLISSTNNNSFSKINFNLNQNLFYGVALNLSKPTIVELCEIQAYEVGVGQTIFSNNFITNSKYLKNFTDPGNIHVKTSNWPLGYQTSYFGKALNYEWPVAPYSLQNFIYVKFNNTNLTKNFLAVPQINGAVIPNNFEWYELPSNDFYIEVDYYLQTNFVFNSTSVSLSVFNGILPKAGETILIDNSSFDDNFSGVYKITNITNNVDLTKNVLKYNYPSQTFIVQANLNLSNNLIRTNGVFYVPFEYGYPAECFTKALKLATFSNVAQNTPSNYTPLYKDNLSNSKMIIYLNEQAKFTKQSDSFILGIGVSNWYPDSTLFGVGLNYEIKEGF